MASQGICGSAIFDHDRDDMTEWEIEIVWSTEAPVLYTGFCAATIACKVEW